MSVIEIPVRDEKVVTVHVPLAFRRRGGRKQVVVPTGGQDWTARAVRVDATLVKAIARAHRWQRMLEAGAFASVADLAKVEQINPSYLCRVLRLTLLAPDIIEAVLRGRRSDKLTLDRLFKPSSPSWERQRQELLG